MYEYILLFLDLSLNNLWTKSIVVVTKNSYIEKLLQLTAVIGIMKYERFSKYLFFSLGLIFYFLIYAVKCRSCICFRFLLFFIYLSLLKEFYNKTANITITLLCR